MLDRSNYSRLNPTLVLCSMLALMLTGAAAAGGSNDKSLTIPEFGGVIEDSHDGPRVKDITPVGGRMENYRDVNLQSGDVVMAVNGQRIESLGQLRDLLSALRPGDEVKMALQRFGSIKMAHYVIGTEADHVSAKELADNYIEIKAQPKSGCGANSRCVVKTIEPGGGVVPCLTLGALLEDSGNKVIVTNVIELPGEHTPPVQLQEGDQLTALQGRKLDKAADLVDRFEQISEGTSVTLTLLRDANEKRLTFEMPAKSGLTPIIIKK